MEHEHGEMDDHMKMRMEWRRNMPIRILTAVIVSIFIFWCGFEFGEIRAMVGNGFHENYGSVMMRGMGGNMEYGVTTSEAPMMHITGSAQAVPVGQTTTLVPAGK